MYFADSSCNKWITFNAILSKQMIARQTLYIKDEKGFEACAHNMFLKQKAVINIVEKSLKPAWGTVIVCNQAWFTTFQIQRPTSPF